MIGSQDLYRHGSHDNFFESYLFIHFLWYHIYFEWSPFLYYEEIIGTENIVRKLFQSSSSFGMKVNQNQFLFFGKTVTKFF